VVILNTEWAHRRDQVPGDSMYVDQVLANANDPRAGNAIVPRVALPAAVLCRGGQEEVDFVAAAVAVGVVGCIAVSTCHGLGLCGGLFIDN